MAPRRLLQLVRGLPPASVIATVFEVDESTARLAAANAITALAHERYDLALPIGEPVQADAMAWLPYMPESAKLPVHLRTDGTTFIRLVAEGAPPQWLLAAFGLCRPPVEAFVDPDQAATLEGTPAPSSNAKLSAREASLRDRLLDFLTVQPRNYVDICRTLGKAATLAPLSSLLHSGTAVRLARGVYGIRSAMAAARPRGSFPAVEANENLHAGTSHLAASPVAPKLSPSPGAGPRPPAQALSIPPRSTTALVSFTSETPRSVPAPDHRTARSPAQMMNSHTALVPHHPQPRRAPPRLVPYRGSGGPAEPTADDIALGAVPDPIAVALFVLADRARRDRTFGFRLDGHGAGAKEIVNAANRILQSRGERLIAYPGTRTSYIA